MVSQNYIYSKSNSLFCIVKYPEGGTPNSAVLLLPGFGESKSDLDYFLDNLSDYFIENGFATVQVDFFAHGDSFGEFENLNCDILCQNIKSSIGYIKHNLGLDVFVVARGFYIELLADYSVCREIKGMVCVNPIKIKTEIIDYLDRYFDTQEKFIEFNELEDAILVSKFLTLLGAEPDNLMGQKISRFFIKDIFTRIKNKAWSEKNYKNIVWITSNSETNGLNVDYLYSQIPYKTLEYYDGYGFSRDLFWQYQLSIRILASIIYIKEGSPYEHTSSIPKSR